MNKAQKNALILITLACLGLLAFPMAFAGVFQPVIAAWLIALALAILLVWTNRPT